MIQDRYEVLHIIHELIHGHGIVREQMDDLMLAVVLMNSIVVIVATHHKVVTMIMGLRLVRDVMMVLIME